MKVFVTGGTGFIGRHLIDRLLSRGDDVTALVRSEDAAAALRARGVNAVIGDVRKPETMREAMAGSDAVFHTAAWYKIGAKDWQQAEEINVQGTKNVLSLAHELGVPRIVYTSTIALYGDTRGRVVDETTTAPNGPFATEYDRTKWRAHYLAALPLIEQGAPVIIVQPGAVYGPGDRSSVAQMMEWFYKGYFPIFPGPELRLHYAHVDDVVEGHLLALERGKPGESYILAGPAVSMRELIELWSKISGRPEPLLYVPPGLVKPLAPLMGLLNRTFNLPDLLSEETVRICDFHYVVSSDKARRELGWQARPLEEGMRQTLAALDRTLDAPQPQVIAQRFKAGKIAALSLLGLLAVRALRRRRKRSW